MRMSSSPCPVQNKAGVYKKICFSTTLPISLTLQLYLLFLSLVKDTLRHLSLSLFFFFLNQIGCLMKYFFFLYYIFLPIPTTWNSSQCQSQSTARTSFHVLSETIKSWKLNSFLSKLLTNLLLVSVNISFPGYFNTYKDKCYSAIYRNFI